MTIQLNPIPVAKHWLEKVLHQLLPRVCSLCEQDLRGDRECAMRLCAHCEEQLPGRGLTRCSRCGLAHPGEQKSTLIAPRTPTSFAQTGSTDGRSTRELDRTPLACELEKRELFPWDAVITWVDYDYPVDGWIHALKFQREASLAWGLGRGIAQALQAAPLPIQKRARALDALVPIPLSRERFAKRGFNQAHLIAQSLQIALREEAVKAKSDSVHAHMIVRSNILKRTKDAPAMSLQAFEGRQDLVRGAYCVTPNSHKLLRGRATRPDNEALPNNQRPLLGLRLGLVDDVMTTGATLAEATRCLKAAGASEIIVMVAARTPKQ
jgi:predicted amidophosphoribosyltransferase